MARLFLILIAMFTLAVCNLHPPSMLHVDEADHHAHVAKSGTDLVDAVADHAGDPATESDPDADHGVAPAGDHHAPPALTVTGSGLENPVAARNVRHSGGSVAALLSWATAPPTQPPSA